MKTKKPLYSILFLSIFFLVSNNAFAQSEKKTKGLFVDFDFSLMIADGDFMGHAALTSGYRFNEKMAAGVEWRSASKFSCCNNFSMSGLGVNYRYTDKWFLGKISLGKVLKATRGEDLGSDWQYQKGGFYYSVFKALTLRELLRVRGRLCLWHFRRDLRIRLRPLARYRRSENQPS